MGTLKVRQTALKMFRLENVVNDDGSRFLFAYIENVLVAAHVMLFQINNQSLTVC